MSEYQKIYNEIDASKLGIISTKYFVDKDDNSVWTHRDITYNSSGLPVLKIYVGETKRVYKEIYINGEKNKEIEYEVQTEPFSGIIDSVEIITCNNGYVTAVNPGQYLLKSNIIGNFLIAQENLNETDLIIIVEEIPKVVKLEWGHENPFVISKDCDEKVSILKVYDNAQKFPLDDSIITQLKIYTSSPHIINTIIENNIKIFNVRSYIEDSNDLPLDAISYMNIDLNDIQRILGENVLAPEMLTVVLGDTLTKDELLEATHGINVKYSKHWVSPQNDLYYKQCIDYKDNRIHLEIKELYLYKSKKYVSRSLDSLYEYEYTINNSTESYPITTPDDFQLDTLGEYVITAKLKLIDDLNFDRKSIPAQITWNIQCIKAVSNYTWTINDKSGKDVVLDVNNTDSHIKVYRNYNDGSSDDVTDVTTFKYDEKVISIKNGVIKPITTGNTTIEISTINDVSQIVTPETYTINIIKQVKGIEIYDSKDNLISKKVGETPWENIEERPNNGKIIITSPENKSEFEQSRTIPISWSDETANIGDKYELTITEINESNMQPIITEVIVNEVIVKKDDEKDNNDDKSNDKLQYLIAAHSLKPNTYYKIVLKKLVDNNNDSFYDFVYIKIEDNKKIITLYVNHEDDLKYKIYPEDATIKEIIWGSTDPEVISIDNSGHLKVLAKGYADITISAKHGLEAHTNLQTNASTECNIVAETIGVTEIQIPNKDVSLYVDENTYYDFNVTVLPENASNKKVKLSFESNVRHDFLTWGKDHSYYLNAHKAGNGVLKITSVDNPDVFVEMKVTAIDNRIQKITINGGNDDDYEFWDNYTNSPEVSFGINNGKHEKWDDDDFPRFYLPINNSMQLTASLTPANAYPNDIVWSTSDGNLVKVTKNGIITAVAENGLDIHGTDSVDDAQQNTRRFPNTCWISAYSKSAKKSAVCLVRVTENNITNINIPSVDIHDEDIDEIQADGSYPEDSNYAQDYIINYGDSIEIPIELEVQDSNFGPSNNIYWNYIVKEGTEDNWDIIQLSNKSINHSNVDDDFDWTSNSPSQVNMNKKIKSLKVYANNIGRVQLQATANKPVYVSKLQDTVIEKVTDETGIAYFDNFMISVEHHHYKRGNDGTIIDDKRYVSRTKLKLVILSNNEHQLFVSVPEYNYDAKPGEPAEHYYNRVTRTIYKDKDTSSGSWITIRIRMKNENEKIPTIKCAVDAYVSSESIIHDIVELSNELSYANIPVSNKYDNMTLTSETNSGFLQYKIPATDIKSRVINIRVVASPNNIHVALTKGAGLIVEGLCQETGIDLCWPEDGLIEMKHSTSKTAGFFIYFDEEFDELLNINKNDENQIPLDNKWMSFACFTSDSSVCTFVDKYQEDLPEDEKPIPDEADSDESAIKANIRNTKCGYGRYFNILPHGEGLATITIVHIASGKTWERTLYVN